MANFVVFFPGTDQKVNNDKHVYDRWARALNKCDEKYIAISNDGVGVTKGTNSMTGAGWAKAIEDSMQKMTSVPQKVIVVGMSRGGVQAIIFAHCLKNKYPSAEVFIFAIDPVQGPAIWNDGSFDMRDNRNNSAWAATTSIGAMLGFNNSRGDLKKKYGLLDDAPKTVPTNVKFYLSVLAQFKGKTRGHGTWGFTPQAPTLDNLVCTVENAMYELPGDHSYGVYTGSEGGGVLNKSRAARGNVTFEMFAHHLEEEGFCNDLDIGFDPMDSLEHYCLIAMEDLAGSQGQNKSSGFSFLVASRKAGAGQGEFNASAATRMHAGRGHLVKSMAVISGKGYYVNVRHKEIYDQLTTHITTVLMEQAKLSKAFLDLSKLHYPNVWPWLYKNAQFAADSKEDKPAFEELTEKLKKFGALQ